MNDVARPGPVFREQVREDSRAFRIGEELGPVSDQPAAGKLELQTHPSRAVVHHLDHDATARAEFLHDDPHVLFSRVDERQFVGFVGRPVNGAGQHPRHADGKFITFPPHLFDQDGHLQFSPAVHQEAIGRFGGLHAHREVVPCLFEQSFPQVARGHVLAVLSAERGIVDGKLHRQRGFVHVERGQGLGGFTAGDAFPQPDAAHSRQRHDLSGTHRGDPGSPEAFVDEQLRDGGRSLSPVTPA